jgi:hypothetical protein
MATMELTIGGQPTEDAEVVLQIDTSRSAIGAFIRVQ